MATVDYLQDAGDETDASSYTFSSQNLGDANTGRYILVFGSARSVNVCDFTAVSVGGVSATILNAHHLGIAGSVSLMVSAIAAVPTGTTGDVVFTISNTCVRMHMDMYRMTGLVSDTPTDSLVDDSVPYSGNIDVLAGGVLFGFQGGYGSAGYSWTNISTDDFDGGTGTAEMNSAHEVFAEAQTGLTVSYGAILDGSTSMM